MRSGGSSSRGHLLHADLLSQALDLLLLLRDLLLLGVQRLTQLIDLGSNRGIATG
jgi:hypothetical protein